LSFIRDMLNVRNNCWSEFFFVLFHTIIILMHSTEMCNTWKFTLSNLTHKLSFCMFESRSIVFRQKVFKEIKLINYLNNYFLDNKFLKNPFSNNYRMQSILSFYFYQHIVSPLNFRFPLNILQINLHKVLLQ